MLSWTSDYLTQRHVEDARLAAEVLLAHAAECKRIDLYARFDTVLDHARIARFRELVKRAAALEPIAYIVGEKEFFSLPFCVTPAVLIPRPETETVVEVVIDHCTREGLGTPWLLDLGTGAGCIAVALLTQLKGANAVATDVSTAALEIAEANAERHGVRDRLTPVQADRLALPAGVVPEGGFDVVVSNPPYVARDALDSLDAGVRQFEPREALTDEHDGLSFYRAIVADAPELLAPHGVVVVEVGDGQAQAVTETVVSGGKLAHRGTWKDRVTALERAVMFSLRDSATHGCCAKLERTSRGST